MVENSYPIPRLLRYLSRAMRSADTGGAQKDSAQTQIRDFRFPPVPRPAAGAVALAEGNEQVHDTNNCS